MLCKITKIECKNKKIIVKMRQNNLISVFILLQFAVNVNTMFCGRI